MYIRARTVHIEQYTIKSLLQILSTVTVIGLLQKRIRVGSVSEESEEPEDVDVVTSEGEGADELAFGMLMASAEQ